MSYYNKLTIVFDEDIGDSYADALVKAISLYPKVVKVIKGEPSFNDAMAVIRVRADLRHKLYKMLED